MKEYKVKVNGTERTVHHARVSAFPFNRVWSGTQRSIDQTETAYFVTFDFCGTADIEIELFNHDSSPVEIRPLKYAVDYKVDGNFVRIKLTDPKHFVLEAGGKSEALHIFSNDVFDAIPEAGDIYFGPGEHFPGVIYPETGQRVIIDEGAVVHGALFINHADNVKILGRGIIDASRLKRGIEAVPGHPGGELAEKLLNAGFPVRDVEYSGAVVAYGCKNLEIDGIIIRDSMFWTLILRNNCENVVINNVKIIGQWRYNSDGINVCCSENVHITNCFIRSFDDCVVMRGAALLNGTGDTRNVRVENNVLWCDWGISLEVWGGGVETTIEDIKFENNYLIHLTNIAMDINTWFGSSRTVINNIRYNDIFIDNDDSYPPPQFQKTDNDKYVAADETYRPGLLRIGCTKLGKNLWHQAHQPAESFDEFNLHYKNITLSNIHTQGDYDVEIKPFKEVLTLENLNLNL